jgi:hypothetical protein
MQGGGYWIDGSYGADSWNITSTQTMALSRASAMTQLATPSTASQVPKEVISDTKRGVSGHFLFGSPNSPGVPGTIETQNPNNMTNSVTLSIFGSQAVQIQSLVPQVRVLLLDANLGSRYPPSILSGPQQARSGTASRTQPQRLRCRRRGR